MPWVQRDALNNIKGIYNLRQPGVADEFLAVTSPEWVAFEQARTDAKTAEDTRLGTFTAETNRQQFVDKLKTATAAEIETFVRTTLNVDGVTDLASAKQAMKRTETAIVRLLQLLVFAVGK